MNRKARKCAGRQSQRNPALATLMLVKDAPGRIEPEGPELGTLREPELIVPVPPETGLMLPRVTPHGSSGDIADTLTNGQSQRVCFPDGLY